MVPTDILHHFLLSSLIEESSFSATERETQTSSSLKPVKYNDEFLARYVRVIMHKTYKSNHQTSDLPKAQVRRSSLYKILLQ